MLKVGHLVELIEKGFAIFTGHLECQKKDLRKWILLMKKEDHAMMG
jgi:hypothetical protein